MIVLNERERNFNYYVLILLSAAFREKTGFAVSRERNFNYYVLILLKGPGRSLEDVAAEKRGREQKLNYYILIVLKDTLHTKKAREKLPRLFLRNK